jgi:hypothetical protein
MTEQIERVARAVDLLDGIGLLIEGLTLPSHAASVTVQIYDGTVTAMGFNLGEDSVLLSDRGLEAQTLRIDSSLPITVLKVESAAPRRTRLRERLAALLDVPLSELDGLDERGIRHALLFLLEASDESIRNERSVALEQAIGRHDAL